MRSAMSSSDYNIITSSPDDKNRKTPNDILWVALMIKTSGANDNNE